MKYILTLMVLFSTSLVSAQDLHFSQFMQSPLTTNPANTGFIANADYRIGGNYKQQWAQLAPYRTFSVWGDAQLFRDKLENGWIGVGGLLLSDVAGRGGLQSNKIYASVAYHQMIGLGSLLSVGFNAGIASKRVNPFVFTWDNQWNGKFFDANQPIGENFVSNNTRYLDLQLGINYAYFPDENRYYNFGFSAHHVNRPSETFFNAPANKPDYNARLSPRYIGFANGSFKVNENVIVNPNIYYTNQARASELVAGGTVNYNLSSANDPSRQIFAGLYYRYKDAVVPMIGVQWKNIQFTFTYDATTSNNLSRFNRLRGGEEMSIIKYGNYNFTSKEARKVGCFMPTF
jgi:type IX secretion system PorP/SprF family membrane protein